MLLDSGGDDFDAESILAVPMEVVERFTKKNGKYCLEGYFGGRITAYLPNPSTGSTTGSLTFKASTKYAQDVLRARLADVEDFEGLELANAITGEKRGKLSR